jgi:hypothetical protein
VARALIVGCGCRGVELGRKIAGRGWSVRGTTRTEDGLARIEAAGIGAAVADPDRPGTVLELVGDVALVVWLMGSLQAEPEVIAAVHGPRLEALLEKLVDTPVRAFAYESVGPVQDAHRRRGTEIVERAAATWSIPVALLDQEPSGDWDAWAEASAQLALAPLS